MNWIAGAKEKAKSATSEKRRWVQSWIVSASDTFIFALLWAFPFASNWVIRKKLSTRVVTRWVVYTLMCSNRVNKLKCHFGFILFAFLDAFFSFSRLFNRSEKKRENLIICCLTVTNFLCSALKMRECLRFIRQTATGGNKEQKYLIANLLTGIWHIVRVRIDFCLLLSASHTELIGEEDLLTFFDWNFNVKYHGTRLLSKESEEERESFSWKIVLTLREIQTRNLHILPRMWLIEFSRFDGLVEVSKMYFVLWNF